MVLIVLLIQHQSQCSGQETPLLDPMLIAHSYQKKALLMAGHIPHDIQLSRTLMLRIQALEMESVYLLWIIPSLYKFYGC